LEISIAAPIFDPSGYSSMARAICYALYHKGIGVTLYPINNWNDSNLDIDEESLAILTEQIENKSIGYSPVVNISVPEQYSLHPLFYTIGYSMIETTGIPKYWVRMCNLMDEIWVPAKASKESFCNSGIPDDKIFVFNLGVDTKRFNPNVPSLSSEGRLQGTKGFNFLLNIEWSPRKCGEDTVKAFLTEFEADEDVALILKAYKPQHLYQQDGTSIIQDIERIKEEIGKSHYPKVVFIPQLLSAEDMPKLYSESDCVLLTTHGEGWGLPITEGMASGKPYIATDWSGLSDIISEDTGYKLGITGLSKIPEFGVPNDRVISGFEWADPNFEQLPKIMRHIYENQEEAKHKGIASREFVEEHLTWDKAVSKLINRLQIIINNLPKTKVYGRISPKIYPPKKAAFVIASLGKKCGIADYTNTLASSIKSQSDILQANIMSATPHPCDMSVPDIMWEVIDQSNVFHYQFEYGLYSKEDILKAKKFLYDKKIICTQHAIDETVFDYNGLIAGVFDYIVVHSDEMRNVLIDLGYPVNKVVVIHHGCWDYGLKPKRQEERIKNIASFGFCFPQKGWLETAIAMKQMPQYEWHLYSSRVPNHANSELYYGRLRKFMDKLDAPNIHWHDDFKEELEVIDKIRNADLIVMPYTVFSDQHAISGAARRCLAIKIPMICTDITYFSDLDEEAYKIRDNSPDSIIEAITYLDKNKELREHMIDRMDKFVAKNSWENIAKKHIEFWEGLK